ncbi:MAG: hypothetical protein PWR20_2148 [Bacteroidales bacterium]|jgi:PAS domain S-box-containing protein|nr:hypothetical protein [Bacteroidales bacterium]MDN5330135.1 hypothetical protein [Bacteroidales bacterium]
MLIENFSEEWQLPGIWVNSILNEFPHALIVIDNLGRVLTANEEASELLSLYKTEPESTSITHILFDEEGYPFNLERLPEIGKSGITDFPLLLKSNQGQSIKLKCKLKSLKEANGEIKAWLCVLQKNDGYEKIENLEQFLSKENLQRLFFSTPQAFAIINGEGKVIIVNPAACNLVGVEEDKLIGRNVNDFILPDYQVKFHSDIDALRHGLIPELSIYEIPVTGGKTKKIKIKAIHLFDDFFVGFLNDVTELHELKDAAEEGSQYLENFFALSGEGFFIAEFVPSLSPEFFEGMPSVIQNEMAERARIVKVNDALARQYQVSQDQIIGRSILDFVKHDLNRLDGITKSLLQSGRAKYQFDLIRSNGEIFLAEGSVALVHDKLGNVTHIIGVQRDISEWQYLRKELIKSHETLHLAQQVARLGTWEMDLFTGINTRNDDWYTMLGYTPDEIGNSHESFLSRVHPEDRTRIEEQIKEYLRNGTSLHDFETEFRMLTKRGTYKWIRSRARVLRDSAEVAKRVIGVHLDVDEYHRSMEVLRLSEITYRGLIDAVSDALYIQDEDGVFLDVNQAAEQMYGYSKQELIGKTPEFLSAEGKNDLNAVMLAFEKALNGEPQRFEFWGRRADGSIFPKEVALSSGNYFGLPCVIAVAHDVTHQMARQKELNDLVNSLQEANAEKDKFFSLIAHDLKSPLSAILGITELLAEDTQKLTLGEIQRLSRSLQLSATNVYSLLENLLEWSRVRRRMIDYRPEYLNLRKVVASVIDTYATVALKKQVGLLNALNDALKVYADERLVETILRNLISNAIKFTPRGGFIKVTAYTKEEGFVLVEVKDTGIGIPDNLLDQLFSLTGKTQRKGTEGEPSTGLGLPLCKELVEIHGGKIWVENNSTKGCRFLFTLPKDEISKK